MGFTDLTIRLLLLFFPGILCFLIVEALTVHRARKAHEILFFSYLYGMLSYLICGFLMMLAGGEINFLKSLTDLKAQLDFAEIAWAALAGVGLAFFVSFCHRKKLLHKTAHRLGVSNKFGETGLWSHALNLDDVRWCVVRDLRNQLMFQGYIRAFSDVEDVAELLLTQVEVYNEQTAELCYRADRMYLARSTGDLTVEFQFPRGEGAGHARTS